MTNNALNWLILDLHPKGEVIFRPLFIKQKFEIAEQPYSFFRKFTLARSKPLRSGTILFEVYQSFWGDFSFLKVHYGIFLKGGCCPKFICNYLLCCHNSKDKKNISWSMVHAVKHNTACVSFFTTFQRMLDHGIPLNIYTSLQKEEVNIPCWMHRITSIIQNAITAESQNKVFSINTDSQLDMVCNLEGKVVVGLLFSHSFLCCGLSAIL